MVGSFKFLARVTKISIVIIFTFIWQDVLTAQVSQNWNRVSSFNVSNPEVLIEENIGDTILFLFKDGVGIETDGGGNWDSCDYYLNRSAEFDRFQRIQELTKVPQGWLASGRNFIYRISPSSCLLETLFNNSNSELEFNFDLGVIELNDTLFSTVLRNDSLFVTYSTDWGLGWTITRARFKYNEVKLYGIGNQLIGETIGGAIFRVFSDTVYKQDHTGLSGSIDLYLDLQGDGNVILALHAEPGGIGAREIFMADMTKAVWHWQKLQNSYPSIMFHYDTEKKCVYRGLLKIEKSCNWGASWSAIETAEMLYSTQRIFTTTDETIYAMNRGGVYVSSATGSGFVQFEFGQNHGNYKDFSRLGDTIDFNITTTGYKGMFSLDISLGWERIKTGILNDRFYLANGYPIVSNDQKQLYFNHDNMAWKTDAESTWSIESTDLPDPSYGEFEFIAANSRHVLSKAKGAFEEIHFYLSMDSGKNWTMLDHPDGIQSEFAGSAVHNEKGSFEVAVGNDSKRPDFYSLDPISQQWESYPELRYDNGEEFQSMAFWQDSLRITTWNRLTGKARWFKAVPGMSNWTPIAIPVREDFPTYLWAQRDSSLGMLNDGLFYGYKQTTGLDTIQTARFPHGKQPHRFDILKDVVIVGTQRDGIWLGVIDSTLTSSGKYFVYGLDLEVYPQPIVRDGVLKFTRGFAGQPFWIDANGRQVRAELLEDGMGTPQNLVRAPSKPGVYTLKVSSEMGHPSFAVKKVIVIP